MRWMVTRKQAARVLTESRGRWELSGRSPATGGTRRPQRLCEAGRFRDDAVGAPAAGPGGGTDARRQRGQRRNRRAWRRRGRLWRERARAGVVEAGDRAGGVGAEEGCWVRERIRSHEEQAGFWGPSEAGASGGAARGAGGRVRGGECPRVELLKGLKDRSAAERTPRGGGSRFCPRSGAWGSRGGGSRRRRERRPACAVGRPAASGRHAPARRGRPLDAGSPVPRARPQPAWACSVCQKCP